MFLYSGFSTEGEMERVRLVGPMAPRTYLCTPVAFVTSSAARLQILADS